MPEIKATHVTIARPIGDDPGTIEVGHFIVEDGEVRLTNRDGVPIASGRMQLGYSSKVGDGETETQVAQRLIWRFYRATKSGNDFNRKIVFPKDYSII